MRTCSVGRGAWRGFVALNGCLQLERGDLGCTGPQWEPAAKTRHLLTRLVCRAPVDVVGRAENRLRL
jgi:hypothetical protein